MVMLFILCSGCLFAVVYLINRLLSPKRLDIKSGHVMITGGSSGIGKALGIEAVKRGANVTIIARKQAVLESAKREIAKHAKFPDKQQVLTVSVDITGDYAVLEREIQKAERTQGPVDMIINCAGFSISDDFENLTMDEFHRLMEVNYFGSVAATKAVIGPMKSRSRGRIVFVSSQAGQVGIYGFTAYSGAKFALRGLAEALQMEVKAHNIYVTLAFPADTDTPGYKEEMIRKPKETHLISETSGLFQPEYVAKVIFKDALQGKFLSHVGLDGFMVAVVTCGMSPVISILDALKQICLMSVFRLVSLFYLVSFDRIVSKCRKEARTGEAKTKEQ